MADAPDTSTYLLLFNDPALPVSRSIALGTGLIGFDTGAGGTYTISATDMLQSVENLPNLSRGFIIKIGSNEVTTRVFTSADDSVTITNPDGVAGDIDFAVAPDQTIQRIQFLNNGVLAATRPAVNFTASGLAGLTLTDNPGLNRLDLNISMTGSASETSTYILKETDSELPNSIGLDSLGGPGLLKFGSDGTPSKAVAGTDYQEGSPLLTAIAGLTPNNGSIISGNGSTFIGIAVGAAGTVPTSNGTSWSWQPNNIWSQSPALQNVNMDNFGIVNISAVRFRDNGLTSGKTFEIANNSGADLSLRINRYQNGVFQDFGILYDSRYNVPPNPSTWATYPASVAASFAGNDLLNGRWLNCVQTRLWQTLSGGSLSGNSYQLAYDATGLKINSINSSGTLVETGYVYDSAINPPPGSSAASVLVFNENDFQVPTAVVTEIGNTISCTQSGYYLLTWEIIVTRFIDGTNFTNITFSNPSAIFYYLKESGSSPANYVNYGTIADGSIYQPVTSGQQIFKYSFSGVANLVEGESYVMAVNKAGSMDWGSASLTCTAIYQAPLD